MRQRRTLGKRWTDPGRHRIMKPQTGGIQGVTRIALEESKRKPPSSLRGASKVTLVRCKAVHTLVAENFFYFIDGLALAIHALCFSRTR